jgi:hypothetical protein
MADEVADRTGVILSVLGERRCLTHQSGDALAQGVIAALNVSGLPGFLRDRCVPLRWNASLYTAD